MFRSQIEQIETYLTEQLGEQVMFSEAFREKFINDIVQAYIHRDAEELAVRKISQQEADKRKHEQLEALAQKPPQTLECYAGLSIGEVDPYEEYPQAIELCFRIPEGDLCLSIATVRTRQLVQRMHDVSGWVEEMTEDQVVVDYDWITPDALVEVAHEWLDRFYPPLASCHVLHLAAREVLMLELDKLARYAGHESLVHMVQCAQREMEED